MRHVRRRVIAAGAVVLLLAATSGVGVASAVEAQGSPDLNPYLPDDEVTPGSDASLDVTIVNNGELNSGNPSDRSVVTTARGVTATLKAKDAPVIVKTRTQAVGQITESEPKTLGFSIVVPDTAEPGTYDLTLAIDYSYTSKANTNTGTGRIGLTTRSRSVTRSVSLTVSDDARFEVTEVDSKLYVGEEGRIAGRLKNIGGTDANNAEVEFTPSNENINALSSTVAVGDVPAGESVPFSIPVEVTSGAEAVPHRFDLNVNYRDEDGISRNTDDPEFLADIDGNRDAFLIEPVSNSIPAGESRPLRMRVTNNLNETVSDIEGKFFADDPLDSTNDETFTGSLDPGETTTVTVDLSAASSATLKNYPASMDFRYVDSEGDSKLTDSYRMAISVTEPETSSGPPIGLIVGLLVVLAGGGYLGWRRGLFDRFTG